MILMFNNFTVLQIYPALVVIKELFQNFELVCVCVIIKNPCHQRHDVLHTKAQLSSSAGLQGSALPSSFQHPSAHQTQLETILEQS